MWRVFSFLLKKITYCAGSVAFATFLWLLWRNPQRLKEQGSKVKAGLVGPSLNSISHLKAHFEINGKSYLLIDLYLFIYSLFIVDRQT